MPTDPYNPFKGLTSPKASTRQGRAYGYTPPVQSVSGGVYAPGTYYLSRTVAGPQTWGYTPGAAGSYGGAITPQGGGNGQAGYFPGLFWPNGEPMLGYGGQQLGGGWGNQNFVYENGGVYRPSYYGQRAYGLSELNVNPETGELQGSLNRFGQPLGTPAIAYGSGPHRPGQGWTVRTPAGTTPRGPQKFNPAKSGQNKGKTAGGGGGGGGGPQQSSKGGPIWYNDLINWNI
jgi:hypothetical protein